MKSFKKIVVGGSAVLGLGLLLATPIFAFAAIPPAQPPYIAPSPTVTGPITNVGIVIDLINKILFWVATLFWIAAAIFVFYAAFVYLTAAGDEEKVKKASHTLLYAVVAIA